MSAPMTATAIPVPSPTRPSRISVIANAMAPMIPARIKYHFTARYAQRATVGQWLARASNFVSQAMKPEGYPMLRRLALPILLVILSAVTAAGQGTVIPSPKFTATDNDGDPCSGCLLYAYAAGTTTAQDTFSDSALTTANANPVVLDSSGRATIYLSASSYKFVLKTSSGSTLWTVDNVQSIGAAAVDAFAARGTCDLRLSLDAGIALPNVDKTGSTLYAVAFRGDKCALQNPDANFAWQMYDVAGDLFLPTVANVANQNYDVFAYPVAGVMTLRLVAWTNDTTHGTTVSGSDGVLVDTLDTTYHSRYLGTFRTTSAGTGEDTLAKRFVWNYYHRAQRPLRVHETTDSWTYTTPTIRQANGATANKVEVVVGIAEEPINLTLTVVASNTNANVAMIAMIGEDSITTMATGSGGHHNVAVDSPAANVRMPLRATLIHTPSAGYHYYAWLEYSGVTGTTTWFGDGGSPLLNQSGLMGFIIG